MQTTHDISCVWMVLAVDSRILLKLISLFPQRVHFGAYPYPPPRCHDSTQAVRFLPS